MSLTVNVIQFGKDSEIALEDGATYADVLKKIPNGRNLDVRSGGVSISEKANQKVSDGEKLTAAPRQVKQGS